MCPYYFFLQSNICADDLAQQPVNPKLFMDRLASLRKELGLESRVSEDNSQDGDIEGRLSSGIGNTIVENPTRVGRFMTL